MIRVLTGPLHSGKTSRLKAVVKRLKSRGVRTVGFLSEAVLEDREIAGYDLFDLGSERSEPFLRRGGEGDRQRTGPYGVVPEGLAKAEAILEGGRDAGLLVVDEVGPLEMRGGGLWPSLERVLPVSNCLVVVQERVLEEFLDRVKSHGAEVFGLEEIQMMEDVLAKDQGV